LEQFLAENATMEEVAAAPTDALKAAGSIAWVTTTGTKQRPDAMKGLWRTLTLVDGGEPVPGAAEAMPAAMSAIRAIALGLAAGASSDSEARKRLDFAGLFHLGPRSSVRPHCASTNLRLRAHLGIAVPSESPSACQLRVAGESRTWAEGSVLVFDDSFTHDAWNSCEGESGISSGGTIGACDRYVLCVDILHPSLSEAQAATVRSLRLLDDFA
jgi:aspartate beta-hydroxylase